MGSDKQPSVLVVDDEPSLVRVVEGYLTTDGFTVRTAGDGETALALARESEPDVVVLDLGLPGMDGVEVCRQLRTFSSCYILMLTARADEVDMLIGLAVGADDYVTKPRTRLRGPDGGRSGARSAGCRLTGGLDAHRVRPTGGVERESPHRVHPPTVARPRVERHDGLRRERRAPCRHPRRPPASQAR